MTLMATTEHLPDRLDGIADLEHDEIEVSDLAIDIAVEIDVIAALEE